LAVKEAENDWKLTTREILIGIAYYGKRKEREYKTAQLVFEKLRININRSAYLEDYFKWFDSEPSIEQIIKGTLSKRTGYVGDVLKSAKKYANRTTNNNLIQIRHLLAAILLFKPKGKAAVSAHNVIKDSGIELSTFIREIQQYIANTFKDDNTEAWGKIFGDLEKEDVDQKLDLSDFTVGLGVDVIEICEKIIGTAGDSNIGLNSDIVDVSYVNLRLVGSEKKDNVAVQIHKYGEYETTIALAVVGPRKGVEVSEPKLTVFVTQGEIAQLSGYKKGTSGERAWLNGNLPKAGAREKANVYIINPEILEHPREKANVYIINPEILEHPDAWYDVEVVLDLGVENIDKYPTEEPDKAQTIGNVATMADDKASVKDLLGRMGLVESLANMFIHNKEMEGFTVALFGNWGEGKSTIMNLLTDKLKEKRPGDFDFATFNAWEYEHTGNIAAGLAQEVVNGLIEPLQQHFWERQILRFKFALKEYKGELWRLAIYSMIAIIIILITNLFFENSTLKGLGLAGGVVAVLFLLFKNLPTIIEHPIATKVETYLKLPSYGEHLGDIPIIKSHLKTLCSLRLVGNKKLIVFVDDLDRCQPKCIAETLDAIRLVTAVQRVNVFICIDHRIAFKATGEHYQKVGGGEGGQKTVEIARIARDYLGKIIQLPIRLQEPTARGLEAFIDGRLFPNIDTTGKTPEIPGPVEPLPDESITVSEEKLPQDEDETVKSPPSEADLSTETTETEIEEITEEEMQDTREERDEFYDMAKKFGFTNPRQLLRLRNCYRLIKALELQKARKEKIELGFEVLKRFMRMLFWQEFLYNRSKLLRQACVNVLYGNIDAETISDEHTKIIIKKVKSSIIDSFPDQEIYDKIAEVVRIVVLPHSQED
jgi:hypothetical protein